MLFYSCMPIMLSGAGSVRCSSLDSLPDLREVWQQYHVLAAVQHVPHKGSVAPDVGAAVIQAVVWPECLHAFATKAGACTSGHLSITASS